MEEIDLRLDTQEPQTIVADLASRVRVIESVGKDDGGCAGASAPVSAFALALMLMALLGVRRRRA